MGYSYRRSEFTLKSFQCFVAQRLGGRARGSLAVLLKEWLARADGRKPVTVGLEFGVVRQLCLYRRRRDPNSFVPDHSWAPVKESTFLPYIFSPEEVRDLIERAGRHRGRNVGSVMFRTLMLILYCTGLRLGEAVRLQLPDVDLNRQSFFIRESKGKSRIVPFRADLAKEIRDYLSARQRIMARVNGRDPGALLLREHGQALSVRTASDAIRLLLRKAGLKPISGRTGPRPYEFRHAFAVHRLTLWYRQGVDIHAKLPWLSAYMGHVNVLGTEVYLAATPELMQLASQRFARLWKRSGKVS
jgi:integrase